MQQLLARHLRNPYTFDGPFPPTSMRAASSVRDRTAELAVDAREVRLDRPDLDEERARRSPCCGARAASAATRRSASVSSSPVGRRPLTRRSSSRARVVHGAAPSSSNTVSACSRFSRAALCCRACRCTAPRASSARARSNGNVGGGGASAARASSRAASAPAVSPRAAATIPLTRATAMRCKPPAMSATARTARGAQPPRQSCRPRSAPRSRPTTPWVFLRRKPVRRNGPAASAGAARPRWDRRRGVRCGPARPRQRPRRSHRPSARRSGAFSRGRARRRVARSRPPRAR